jgi:hypothetical protein
MLMGGRVWMACFACGIVTRMGQDQSGIVAARQRAQPKGYAGRWAVVYRAAFTSALVTTPSSLFPKFIRM